MVNHAVVTSQPALKCICFAVLMASAVAGAPSEQDSSDGSASAATSKAAAPQPQAMTAQAAAEKIKAAIPEVSLITITGENDANNMIGRTNG